MAHKVETMAYRGEVPWHGLGNRVEDGATAKQMAVAAGVDGLIILKRPLVAGRPNPDADPEFIFDNPVAGHFGLVRSDNGKVLEVVGSKFQVTQPRVAVDFLHEFVSAGDATMETMGILDEGRLVWGLAKLGTSDVKPGDAVNEYLLVALPYMLGKANIVKRVHERVVCHNTYTAALRENGAEYRLSHRRAFGELEQAEARHVLGLAREQLESERATMRALANVTMAYEDVLKTLAGVFDPDLEVEPGMDLAEKGNRAINKVMMAYATAPGADPGTAWGAFNAATYYADHVAGRNPDSRLRSAWFGQMANAKDATLDALLVGAGLK
jgi:phage/plasmid-like protein (TIGR03299 family)